MSSEKQKLDEVRADTPLHSVHSQDNLSAAYSTEKVNGIGEGMAESTGLIGTLRKTWRVATQGTVVSSIFILLTTCVGAGTLSLPYGFTQGGLVFSSVVFFVIMVSLWAHACSRSPLTVVKSSAVFNVCTYTILCVSFTRGRRGVSVHPCVKE